MLALFSRAFSRAFYHAAKVVLIPVESVHPRLYMSLMIRLLRFMGLGMTGRPRYISRSAYFDDFRRIRTGDRLVISRNVVLLTHDYSLTTALIAIGETPATDVALNREIVIGDNVFLGLGCTLLPGTVIGDNVIVAAGSVVRGTIAGDNVIAGNPARQIGTILDRAAEWRARAGSTAAAADGR